LQDLSGVIKNEGWPMLETAIVGGGLCGVALARSLRRQGRSVALFEARRRLGGRILSVTSAGSGLAMDLGPTWFWPQTQPFVTGLIADLGFVGIPQYEDGAALHLHDPDKTPERIEGKTFHEGAHRLEGGMAGLIDTLAAELSPDHTHLGHVLTDVEDRGDHVALKFVAGDDVVAFESRHVVLALPPRLLEEYVRFEPDLDETTREALGSTETWMAAQAKVMVGYDRPYWREAGQSGSAFVSHGQAVIGEIFDACDGSASKAGLGGFLALSPDQRTSFSVGLPVLMDSQLAQVFGSALEQGEQHYQDWAKEPFTCSSLDRSSPASERADIASPMLRRPQWNGKLFLGGSETAARGAGHLEGALEAAHRIDQALNRGWAMAVRDQPRQRDNAAGENAASTNAACLARFDAWIAEQRDAAFDSYRRHLNRDLAAQRKDQLTQRAILESMEEVFDRALAVLDTLDFDMDTVTVERGRSSLIPDVQQPFGELMRSALDDVVAFNRTSCALSNFPDEHRLSKEYTQVILRDIAAAWLEFSLSANRLLLAKAETAHNQRPHVRGLTIVSS
jgi:monoamine oxidase